MRPSLAWLAVTAALATPGYSVAQDRFLDSDGVQIRYIELGAGQPIRMTRGSTGRSSKEM